MVLVIDDCIEADELFGPLPNFIESFENYFIKKSAALLIDCKSREIRQLNKYGSDKDNEQFELISLKESKRRNNYAWMYNVPLAKNSREQNLDIIYNNKLVYFKALRKIFKSEYLFAFPSKDLEISLGLQFIPFNGESDYKCRKCNELFNQQFCLMLHSKFFCKSTSNVNFNNLKRKMNDFNEDPTRNSKLAKLQDQKEKYSGQQDHPLQLTTVTNQLNMQSNDLKISNKTLNSEKSQTCSSSQSLTDFINDQNSSFYAKYFQSLQSLFPTGNNFSLFLQNQTNNDCEFSCSTPLNVSPIYSIPGLMNSIINNSTSKNQTLSSDKASDINSTKPSKPDKLNVKHKETSLKKSTHVGNAKTSLQKIQQFDTLQQTVQTGNLNSKPQQLQNLEMITAALNFQALQNWCAKCNTQFRLTSDLVYHMRTFHRKEESMASLINQSKTVKEREQKYLKCEICNENFKEKHHLTRHMTSHR